MNAARMFELAGAMDKVRPTVTGDAHAAANCMVDGTGRKSRHKAAISTADEALRAFEQVVFAIYPAALTYRPDMPEAELRAWAASIVEALP